jgi:hypothetical protein
MRTQANSLILAAFALTTLGGCIVHREVVREEPQASLPAPPPPPSDEVDAAPAPVAAAAPVGGEVDEQVFVEQLSPYGHWEWVPDYGNVWVPAVAVGWRPYWYGHWVLTEWGWTFASDDPWGWATYHYGRWGFSAGTGWYWVPGRVWGPAWVSWRYGGGYCAWAPLGPRGYVYGYSSPAWIAVRQEHFTQPIVRHAVVDVRHTAPIVQRAQPLAAPRTRPAAGTHFGPPVASVSAATGQPIRPVRAATVVPRSVSAPSAAAAGGRSTGSAPAARAAPSDGSGGSVHSGSPSAAPSSAAPSSSAPPASAPSHAAPSSGSSGRSGASPAPSNSTPRAAPAHGGGGAYRIQTGTPGAPSPQAAPGADSRSAGGAPARAAPAGQSRFGGGPAPKAPSGRASAARNVRRGR